MSDIIKISEEDLKALSLDDSLEIVISKFPLKYILRALIGKHGLTEVSEALRSLEKK